MVDMGLGFATLRRSAGSKDFKGLSKVLFEPRSVADCYD